MVDELDSELIFLGVSGTTDASARTELTVGSRNRPPGSFVEFCLSKEEEGRHKALRSFHEIESPLPWLEDLPSTSCPVAPCLSLGCEWLTGGFLSFDTTGEGIGLPAQRP